jgi:hypothetical protein
VDRQRLRYGFRSFTAQHQERTMFVRRLTLCLAATAALGLADRAPAEILYDSFAFGAHPEDGAPLGQLGAFDFHAAYPFEIEAGSFTLDSITLSLWTDVDGGTPNGDWLLRLREQAGNNLPGNVIEEWTLDNTALPGQTTVHEFVSATSPVLAAGQRYWVHLTTVAGSGFAAWNGSLATTLDFVSANEGDNLNPVWEAPTAEYLIPLFTVVPEPGQVLMLASGAAVLSAAALRRRRRA